MTTSPSGGGSSLVFFHWTAPRIAPSFRARVLVHWPGVVREILQVVNVYVSDPHHHKATAKPVFHPDDPALRCAVGRPIVARLGRQIRLWRVAWVPMDF